MEEAKKLRDVLIVSVNTNNSVKKNKGDKHPINNEISGASILAALGSIDYVLLFDEKDPSNWLGKIKPNIHVKAGDYKLSQIIEKNIVEDNGGRIVITRLEKDYSTTNLINKILSVYKEFIEKT